MTVRTRHNEPFSTDDLRLAEEFVARAAVCVDNARRYTREREAALGLQRRLMPRSVPDQRAVTVASAYRPANELSDVGGNWFDVIALSGARVALADKASFPRDKACGDLVGPRGVQLLAELGVHVPDAGQGSDLLAVGPSGRASKLPAFPGRSSADPARRHDRRRRGLRDDRRAALRPGHPARRDGGPAAGDDRSPRLTAMARNSTQLTAGIVVGGLIGIPTIAIAGAQIGLTTSGGALIMGLVFGWLRAKYPTFGQFPPAAEWLMDTGGLCMRDCLNCLRHHRVVGCDDEHNDIGDLCSARAHCSKRFVAGSIEEGDFAAIGKLNRIGTDMLRNSAGLTCNDVRIADIIEQRSLPVIDVAHDGDNRRTGLECFRRILDVHQCLFSVVLLKFYRVPEFVGDQLYGVLLETLID